MCCKALDLKAASLATPRISALREFQRTAPACVTNLVECAEAAARTISRLLLPHRVLRPVFILLFEFFTLTMTPSPIEE